MLGRRLSDITLVAIAAVAMLVVTAVGAFIAPVPNAVDSGGSSFSAGPLGTKAAFLTLRELGYAAERSYEPLTALKTVPARTVLLVSGHAPPSAGDQRAVQQFLEDGGTVVATGVAGAALLGFKSSGVSGAEIPHAEVRTHRRLAITPVSADAEEISLPEDAGNIERPSGYVAVYGANADRPVVVSSAIGRGTAVWLVASTPMTNESIEDADNLQLLLNFAGTPGEKRVIFDEHYHGFTRSLWSYAVGTPLPWVTLQLGLVALAAFLTFSRRHGPMRAPATDPRTSPMEFVEMLGALYQRSQAPAAAVAAARARLRRTLAATCGVPAGSDDESLARAAAARLGGQADEIADLLATSEQAGADPDLGVQRALKLTRELQGWTARLQAVRGSGELSGGIR